MTFESLQPTSETSNPGPKVYKFLERTGFLDLLANKNGFHEWINNLSFESFLDHITRLNGMIREVSVAERNLDTRNVMLVNEKGAFEYISPHIDDKVPLLREAFDVLKKMDSNDAALFLFYVLQKIHPFKDGNGRTGRLLYLLLENHDTGEKLNFTKVKRLLWHSGNSGPGREIFQKTVLAPEYVDVSVRYFLALDEFGDEFVNKYRGIDSRLTFGTINLSTNYPIAERTKKELEWILSEAYEKYYNFRDLVLVKFLKETNTYEEHVTDEEIERSEKKMLVFDGNELLKHLTQKDAERIIEIHRDLKKKFVRKYIDIFNNPDKYKENEVTIKDFLAQKNQASYT